MRKTFLSSVAAAALMAATHSQPLMAADPFFEPPPPQAPALTWSGPYIGGHLGWGESNWSGTWDPSESPTVGFGVLDADGVVGGMHLGYNHQFGDPFAGLGSFVLGIEGDLSAVGLMDGGDSRFNRVDGSEGAECHAPWSAQCGSRVDLLASVRGRLGLALGQFMPYATVGAGWVSGDAFVGSSSTGQSWDFNSFGVVWGGGVEYMAAQSLVIGAEFLQYRVDDKKKINFEATVGDHIELDHINVVRVRASWKF